MKSLERAGMMMKNCKNGKGMQKDGDECNIKWTIWVVMWRWWYLFAKIQMLVSSSSPPHQICLLSFSFYFNIFNTPAQIIVILVDCWFLAFAASATFHSYLGWNLLYFRLNNASALHTYTYIPIWYYFESVIWVCTKYTLESWQSCLFRFNSTDIAAFRILW